MPIEPIDRDTKEAIGDILSLFQKDYEAGSDSSDEFLSKIFTKYNVHLMDAVGFTSFLSNNSDVRMRDNFQYLLLEQTKDKKIWPLVTIHSSGEWVNLRIYTLLTMLDENSDIQAISIRFETDEGIPRNDTIGSHDFCHAQFCHSIGRLGCATSLKWLSESQPSIPVDAEDQISLVLCMLVSLYGGKHVLQRINESQVRDVRKHLRSVRAFHSLTVDS